jgi:outer membrane murein-binding lipoprotein Lpp
MRPSIAVLVFLILAGCHSASKAPTMDIDRLADAYVSLVRLKAQLGRTDSSMTAAEFEQRAADSLKARGFDRAEFQRQFEAIGNSPEEVRKFNQRVQALMPGR